MRSAISRLRKFPDRAEHIYENMHPALHTTMGRILEAKLSVCLVWIQFLAIPFLVAGILFVEAFQFPFHQENPLQ